MLRNRAVDESCAPVSATRRLSRAVQTNAQFVGMPLRDRRTEATASYADLSGSGKSMLHTTLDVSCRNGAGGQGQQRKRKQAEQPSTGTVEPQWLPPGTPAAAEPDLLALSEEEIWVALQAPSAQQQAPAAQQAAMDTSGVVQFADFDLTLTDRDLDDFLSFMEHQTTGAEYGDSMPQLPDVAMDFPGLQLQPHSGSPSRSEGSDSAGVGASGEAGTEGNSGQRPALAASDGSLTSAAMSSPAHEASVCRAASSGGNPGAQPQQQQQQGNSARQQRPPAAGAASPTDISSQQMQQPPLPPLQQPLPVKPELSQQQQQQQQIPVQFPAASSLPAVLAGSAGLPANATSLAGTLAGPVDSTTALMMSCPTAVDAGGYSLQPMQWHSSSAITAAAVAASAAQAQQPMPQLRFMQAPGVPGMMQQAGPQLSSLMQPSPVAINQQLAAFAGLASPTGDPSCSTAAAMERQASAGGRASRQLQGLMASPSMQARAGAGAYADGPNGSGKQQVSHSTVEKQRRDRLNSLIDELSDMVPPADPKYGADTNSVRRPKHVVLADTINLLKAMQTKLQIEEAEICTLKQHAAAVGAMAAQHQVGHAAVPEAADAMMQAAAAAGASPDREFSAGGYGDACEGGMPVELPCAPECGGNSTGVLVEQGIGCLYVKVNCKDRKGLLSDVVSALKAFPVVICTAAITTTKDGKVHDVFEVRIEDPSVSAEDIQCAVQQALFAAAAARSKRLRREDSAGLMQG